MNPAAGPHRPLPIRPRPMAGESPASYLRRLARANHLRPGYLRRYLREPGSAGTIRLDWLAILAGRPLPVLERALTGQAGSRAPARYPTRRPDKPSLVAAIRRDARDSGLSIRALADRHGVHRRTVRQALASPWPAPRKSYERRSKLAPFKDTIDAMLLPEANGSGSPRRAVKEIFDRLVAEHMMTSVSYATVRDYVTSRRPVQSSGSSHADSDIRDAQMVIMHLKGLFGRMTSGIADEAEPHLNALELVIREAQAPADLPRVTEKWLATWQAEYDRTGCCAHGDSCSSQEE